MKKKDEGYVNGQKVSIQKGDVLTYFYKSGDKKAWGKFTNDMMEGKWTFNREGNQLWQIGHFLHNKKHGEWIRYDKKDQVEYHAVFENGKLVEKIK